MRFRSGAWAIAVTPGAVSVVMGSPLVLASEARSRRICGSRAASDCGDPAKREGRETANRLRTAAHDREMVRDGVETGSDPSADHEAGPARLVRGNPRIRVGCRC